MVTELCKSSRNMRKGSVIFARTKTTTQRMRHSWEESLMFVLLRSSFVRKARLFNHCMPAKYEIFSNTPSTYSFDPFDLLWRIRLTIMKARRSGIRSIPRVPRLPSTYHQSPRALFAIRNAFTDTVFTLVTSPIESSQEWWQNATLIKWAFHTPEYRSFDSATSRTPLTTDRVFLVALISSRILPPPRKGFRNALIVYRRPFPGRCLVDAFRTALFIRYWNFGRLTKLSNWWFT